MDSFPFGERAIVRKGSADLKKILQDERAGSYIKKVQEETIEQGEMLVLGKNVRTLLIQLLIFYSVGRGYITRQPS